MSKRLEALQITLLMCRSQLRLSQMVKSRVVKLFEAEIVLLQKIMLFMIVFFKGYKEVECFIGIKFKGCKCVLRTELSIDNDHQILYPKLYL